MLKPRRLELGSQLSASIAPQLPHLPSRVPLLQGLEEERGIPCDTGGLFHGGGTRLALSCPGTGKSGSTGNVTATVCSQLWGCMSPLTNMGAA